jgi:hypothetical protein
MEEQKCKKCKIQSAKSAKGQVKRNIPVLYKLRVYKECWNVMPPT